MSDSCPISCGSRLSIDQAESLYERFEAAVLAGGDVVLDAGEVEYSDTAGYQLIISLNKTLATTGHTVKWQEVSDNIREITGYLGLKQVLNLPE